MKDNWGDRARFGMFVVGNEAVPEAEWWAMAPAGVSIHAARVTARAPWARWDSERREVVLESDLERARPNSQPCGYQRPWSLTFRAASLVVLVGMRHYFQAFTNSWWGNAHYH
jgi:Maleate cis-trans isomerase